MALLVAGAYQPQHTRIASRRIAAISIAEERIEVQRMVVDIPAAGRGRCSRTVKIATPIDGALALVDVEQHGTILDLAGCVVLRVATGVAQHTRADLRSTGCYM